VGPRFTGVQLAVRSHYPHTGLPFVGITTSPTEVWLGLAGLNTGTARHSGCDDSYLPFQVRLSPHMAYTFQSFYTKLV